MTTAASKTTTVDAAAQASIGAGARELHLPTVRTEAARLAEIADRERHTHLHYLAEVLAAEVDDRTERRRVRRINDAKFPRLKRLAEFNIDAVPSVAPATLGHLAAGHYLDAGEPVVLLGDSGTGKSHLLIGLGLAACEQGRRVRYVTTESPWKCWRLLTLETRMESCRRNSRRASRPVAGTARRRRPLQYEWCGPCVLSWAPSKARSPGWPANWATAWNRCVPGCARPTSTTGTLLE